MARFVITRTIQSLLALFGVSIISFMIIRALPGDPTTLYFEPGKPVPQAAELAALRARYGLDQPIPIQYLTWLGNILRGDFGFSSAQRRPALQVILETVPPTLLLTTTALTFSLVLSIPIALVSARYRYTLLDYGITVLSFISISLPRFFLALILQFVVARELRWFPTSGMSDARETYYGMQAAVDVLWHLVLPALALGLTSLAQWVRYQRSSLLNVLSQDYVRTAHAKGLNRNRVYWVHALRNALLPTITLVGLSLSLIIAGAFTIEVIFSWPGMGRLYVDSILKRDYAVVMGTVMIIALIGVFGNFLADIVYHWVDPRIRYE
jgi:peptide/nickel transport system permease protein